MSDSYNSRQLCSVASAFCALCVSEEALEGALGAPGEVLSSEICFLYGPPHNPAPFPGPDLLVLWGDELGNLVISDIGEYSTFPRSKSVQVGLGSRQYLVPVPQWHPKVRH